MRTYTVQIRSTNGSAGFNFTMGNMSSVKLVYMWCYVSIQETATSLYIQNPHCYMSLSNNNFNQAVVDTFDISNVTGTLLINGNALWSTNLLPFVGEVILNNTTLYVAFGSPTTTSGAKTFWYHGIFGFE